MTTSEAAGTETARGGVLGRHPLLFFFLIAFAGAWLVEAPVVLSRTGTGLLPFTIPGPLAALMLAAATFTGPTLSAFVMTASSTGGRACTACCAGTCSGGCDSGGTCSSCWSSRSVELLGALVLPGVAASYQSPTLSMALSYPAAFAATFVLGGPLGEEPGWRGFALPRLQPLHGPLLGSVILGVLWASWHLPLFWSGVWTPPTLANIAMFIVMITALTVVMSWVFNNAQGSLLITMLMHASFNTFANKVVAPLFPAPLLDEYGLLPELVGFGVLAVVVVAVTRGRLGYGNYRLEEHSPATAALT